MTECNIVCCCNAASTPYCLSFVCQSVCLMSVNTTFARCRRPISVQLVFLATLLISCMLMCRYSPHVVHNVSAFNRRMTGDGSGIIQQVILDPERFVLVQILNWSCTVKVHFG